MARGLDRYHTYLLATALMVASMLIYFKPPSVLDTLLSQDQQAQLLFWQGDFAQAAKLFNDSYWQGYSHYAAGNFKQSALTYKALEGQLARFSEANSLAHQRQYYQAKAIYKQMLRQDSKFTPAWINLETVEALIEEMEKLDAGKRSGQKQKQVNPEDGKQESQANNHPGRNDKNLSESRQRQHTPTAPKEAWLTKIEPEPIDFLRRKFSMEYEQQLLQQDGQEAQ